MNQDRATGNRCLYNFIIYIRQLFITLPLFEIIKVIIPLILPGNFFDEFQLMVMIIRPMMVPESSSNKPLHG